MTTKPDYSKSAVSLCNPREVMDLLVELHAEQLAKGKLEEKLKEQCAELVDGIAKSCDVIAEIQEQIREAIDRFGSYQDTESGEYAVKYRRMKREYNVEAFKQQYPKYASAVVEETINVKALDGLIIGGLIKEEDLLREPATGSGQVITETPQYAYYIR